VVGELLAFQAVPQHPDVDARSHEPFGIPELFLMLAVNTWPRLTLSVFPHADRTGLTRAYWRLNEPVMNGIFVAFVGRA